MQDGPVLTPVVRTERISAVDTVRGVALLGILLINIVSFALPADAYDEPSIAGGATGINLATWTINYVLFEGKMRALFSMLFGAGVVLLSSRLEQRDPTAAVADIYYRRVLWLLAFGLVHAYFFWEGDILYFYAVSGLILFPFRKLKPKALILTGVLVLAVLIPKNLREARGDRLLYDKAAAADAAAAAGETLTEGQRDAQEGVGQPAQELEAFRNPNRKGNCHPPRRLLEPLPGTDELGFPCRVGAFLSLAVL